MARFHVQRPRALSALLIASLCALVGALITTTTATAGGPVAKAAKTCTVKNGDYPGDGYLTLLNVTGVSCAKGKSLQRSYYKCRLKKGKKGRCSSRVQGYRCKETRTTIPTEINGRVSCSRGSKKIRFAYQQNT